MTLDVNTVEVDPAQAYDIVGVLNRGRGLLYRESMAGSKTAYKTLNRIGPNQVVYSRLKAFEGAITVAPADLHEVYASQEFPTFTCGPSLLPDYFRLLTTTKRLWDTLQNLSTGMGGRRERVKPKDFLTINIALPSLTEQNRIVNLMSTVDAQLQALRAEIGSAQRLLSRLLAESFEDTNGDESAIVDLCSHVVGGIWGSPEGESEVDVLALGPRIYAPGTSDFVTDGSPTRSFTLKQIDSRLVHENDIILERSGGSADQPVGRVVIAGSGLSPCVPTDFQRLMRPDPALVEPRYLFWRLQHDWNQGLTRDYSRRTTGITNLSVKDYIARVIQVPGRAEQVDLVQRADAVETAVRAGEEELAHLRVFRSTLLTALLNQEIEIVESYDDLLEKVS
jgi:type I restriction enzyme S subunit